MSVYVIIADGIINQTTESYDIAIREKKDLVKMGCTVRIKNFATWEKANHFEDLMNRKWS